ncbi:terminase [blood disease bacterium A2-HR MARDI]|uniref:Terminase n=3 Tax=Ralstonia syzygii TaxID=28097 RepID=A0A1U9VEW6_9RALS|nr:terminase [blood disease bacterium A2-HR MARDI]CCA79407.1 putative phage terminase large subunit [blood disease bacterium R229]
MLLARELKRRKPWRPLAGPQSMAYDSLADVIGYGGAAGGGKTDLACGKSLTQHQRVMILRREATQLTGIIDRFTELLNGRDGYNGADRIWRLPERGVQIEFGSVPNAGDEIRYQGRPHDLLVFDEAANFLESQIRFLLGWLRTTTPGQRCQALLTFNPPTNAEGRWVIDFFAPWLDPKHPAPAAPGELRWFATLDGEDVEVESGEPFTHNGELVKPMSRTFIPSRVSDNPYLMGTGYMATLQALPEPLRSQMLYGDFQAGIEDDPWQVVPTAWVELAMARWKPVLPKPQMDSLGVDVARGGRDNTVIARRHGMWFDEPLAYPGTQTPDGPTVAGLVIAAMRDGAPIHLDVIGVGSAPYDFLNQANQHVLGVNVAEKAAGTDKSGRLRFFNQRSELWWRMREALDPANNTGIALPPDTRLRADLCAPTWELQGATVKVESRDEIEKRIGRSPDWASAYILALMDTPRLADIRAMRGQRDSKPYDPYAELNRQ